MPFHAVKKNLAFAKYLFVERLLSFGSIQSMVQVCDIYLCESFVSAVCACVCGLNRAQMHARANN